MFVKMGVINHAVSSVLGRPASVLLTLASSSVGRIERADETISLSGEWGWPEVGEYVAGRDAKGVVHGVLFGGRPSGLMYLACTGKKRKVTALRDSWSWWLGDSSHCVECEYWMAPCGDRG